MKFEGLGRIILRINLIRILKIKLHSTCVALVLFREAIISPEGSGGENVKRLKNCKAAAKDDFTGEIIDLGWIRLIWSLNFVI